MAVYTKISHNELAELISGYDIGALKSFVAIEAGIQNTNYFVITDIKRYVLTIYERRVNHEDLPFFLNLMGHLAKQSVPCPALITDKNGVALNQIQGKPCAITSFLNGGEVKTIQNGHIELLGTAIAHMHIAGESYKERRDNALSLQGWINIFAKIEKRADELQNGLAAEISTNLDFLVKNWPANLPSGIIHADIFPDNVFFDNDQLAGIIDFYFACNDSYMYELAICLNSWCFDLKNQFNPAMAALLFSSYNKVRKISDAEFAALPVLARGAALRFLLTRMQDWLYRTDGAIVIQKDPIEYLQKLRFHANIHSFTDYS